MSESSMLPIVVWGTLLLAACAPTAAPAAQPAAPANAVTGTVTYLQRSALPPTAVYPVLTRGAPLTGVDILVMAMSQ